MRFVDIYATSTHLTALALDAGVKGSRTRTVKVKSTTHFMASMFALAHDQVVQTSAETAPHPSLSMEVAPDPSQQAPAQAARQKLRFYQHGPMSGSRADRVSRYSTLTYPPCDATPGRLTRNNVRETTACYASAASLRYRDSNHYIHKDSKEFAADAA